jgi:hypothetical protein
MGRSEAKAEPAWPIEHTPPTTMYLLPVLGGRNVFESNLVVSDLAAASKASFALILCGEKAEATSWGSFMSLASFKRMYKYTRRAKRRARRAIVGFIRTEEVGQCITIVAVTWQFCLCVTAWSQYKRACPTVTKARYIHKPNDRKTHYRLDLQIEHANESGTRQEAGVVVLVHWGAGLDQHPQRQGQSHPEMHNTDCIVPSDLLAIL